MKYDNVRKGIFISRPNRFIAYVNVDGVETICHVKNTGRCKELLVPGAVVYLEKSTNPDRKTAYDLIAVEKGKNCINIDSQAPNKVYGEWLQHHVRGLSHMKAEKKHGESRFDFYYEVGGRKVFSEVKGVTLESDGVARFPDAPTERGVKHLRGLMECVKEGFSAEVIFIVQMDCVKYFEPNRETHAKFAEVLREAMMFGVKIKAYTCAVLPDEIVINGEIEVKI